MMISSAPATAAVAMEMPNAMRLIRIGGAHQAQRKLVLRHRRDGAADERVRQEQLKRGEQRERSDARHQHAQREIHQAEMQARPDIRRLDVAIIDAEYEDQPHFGDEQQPEKEREAAQRFLAVPLEQLVIDLIDAGAQQIEHRQHDDADQDRIDPKIDIDDVGDVGAEDDEGGMGDVDDVEDAERDRNADRHRGVEPAEQDAGDHRVEQQSKLKPTCSPTPTARRDVRMQR